MIDLSATNEWQHRDADGMVLPWYTKSFLDELVTWDLSDKIVFEYGAGASTVWWNKKAKHVFTVESNERYFEALIKHIGSHSVMMYTPSKADYIEYSTVHPSKWDIVIVDGEPIAWRDDCIKTVLPFMKPGGCLIIDNWLQPSVGWMPSEETQRLLSQYPVQVYAQEGHPDWKTAVFTIGKVIDNINLTEVSLLENGKHGIGYTTH